MSYLTNIRRDGEIRRLKTKCEHASEELEKIDKAIRDWDLTLDEQKDELREWVDSLREYLSQE
ncbi:MULTISPECIES: hypothetical protein [unclassified Clostridium]|uniref:hypothetical protein n=1 Tax=unclassified Clostridium TaxID=2614128 RepID=UPI000297FA09|nr:MULTISPECIES: hypothetical protein [unclassified Clostridium]EKQ50297.1 MAG: hypothetical protein A370_05743 [Clostridium sp. Maddingley MBC34-26]